MGLIKKFSDLLRSNLNTWLDQAENPQKLAELAITEAEETKKKAQGLLIKAQSAFNIGDSELKYLRNQLVNSSKEQEIQTEIARVEQEQTIHQQTINIIKRGLKALDHQISQLKSKAATSAEHVHDSSAFDTFSRMEEKIESSEAEIEALKELFELAQKDIPSLGKQPDSLKTSLEEELEALKKKLNKG